MIWKCTRKECRWVWFSRRIEPPIECPSCRLRGHIAKATGKDFEKRRGAKAS